jgi:hypothetical protein
LIAGGWSLIADTSKQRLSLSFAGQLSKFGFHTAFAPLLFDARL